MNKTRILLAEDELALAHIVRESLEHENFEVILCTNGEQALQKGKADKVDTSNFEKRLADMKAGKI